MKKKKHSDYPALSRNQSWRWRETWVDAAYLAPERLILSKLLTVPQDVINIISDSCRNKFANYIEIIVV
jgi:hypothetical protein